MFMYYYNLTIKETSDAKFDIKIEDFPVERIELDYESQELIVVEKHEFSAIDLNSIDYPSTDIQETATWWRNENIGEILSKKAVLDAVTELMGNFAIHNSFSIKVVSNDKISKEEFEKAIYASLNYLYIIKYNLNHATNTTEDIVSVSKYLRNNQWIKRNLLLAIDFPIASTKTWDAVKKGKKEFMEYLMKRGKTSLAANLYNNQSSLAMVCDEDIDVEEIYKAFQMRSYEIVITKNWDNLTFSINRGVVHINSNNTLNIVDEYGNSYCKQLYFVQQPHVFTVKDLLLADKSKESALEYLKSQYNFILHSLKNTKITSVNILIVCEENVSEKEIKCAINETEMEEKIFDVKREDEDNINNKPISKIVINITKDFLMEHSGIDMTLPNGEKLLINFL